jgi:hypothetical protein
MTEKSLEDMVKRKGMKKRVTMMIMRRKVMKKVKLNST